MDASAQSPASVVNISPDSITLGRYGFDARRVQAVRVWISEPRRSTWGFLLVLFAGLTYFISGGFEGGGLSWSFPSDPLRATLGVLLAISVPFLVWSFFFRDSTRVCIVQLKRDGRWTNAWATLDGTAAENVATTIRRSIGGDQVSLSLPPGFSRDAGWLLFGDRYFPIGEVVFAASIPQQANRASEIGGLISGAGFLLLSLHRLVEALTGPDSPLGWLVIALVAASLLLITIGFAIDPVIVPERSTRYVHIVQLRGTFGRRNVYATLNQAEADSIVADINSAIAANRVP